jgi:hypothetical protein
VDWNACRSEGLNGEGSPSPGEMVSKKGAKREVRYGLIEPKQKLLPQFQLTCGSFKTMT